MLKIDKGIIDYLNQCKVTYNKETGNVCINGQDTDEYDIRVICEKIKYRYKTDIDKNVLIQILNDTNSYTVIEQNNDLEEFTKLIEEDSTLKESDWELYKKWKQDEALWKTDKDGCKTSLVECQANIVGFLENFPKYKGKIYFNEVRNYAEYKGIQVDDAFIFEVLSDVTKYMLPCYSSPKGIKNAIDQVVFKNKTNPIKQWMLDNYEQYYDPDKDYISYILSDVFRCEDLEDFGELYYAELKLHLLASIKKLCYAKFESDFKYDNILVLCSVQGGTGKTTFPDLLYTFDKISYTNIWEPESINFSNKDFLEQLHDSACNIFDEVSVRRNIFNAVKSFISKQSDKFRKSYAYLANNKPRKFVLWGTSNNNDFLKDYTAGLERRWMIIHLTEDKMNGVYLKKLMLENDGLLVRRIWAQAMHMYKENPNFDMYLTHDWDESLTKLQREYKASNNEDYDTIINGILETEFGYYDENSFDVESIVAQWKYGNPKEWCIKHNDEYKVKENKSIEGKYIMKPEDREIKFWGKIDRIRKTTLYEILNNLKIEYTKPTLAGELKITNKWNGWDNKPCNINGKSTKAYWRVDKVNRIPFDIHNLF